MASKDWTCPPREHHYAEASRFLGANPPEPIRLYCVKCGWVREVPEHAADERAEPTA